MHGFFVGQAISCQKTIGGKALKGIFQNMPDQTDLKRTKRTFFDALREKDFHMSLPFQP